jgi:putative transposase
MRFQNNVFVELLKPIDRRAFGQIVARHDGDAYDKSFKSWDHLVALIFAQLSSETSLRGLVTAFNANSGAHYHLGTRRLARSTLAEANARRPVGVFAELFARLSGELDRRTRRDGAEVLRLIDSTPIPLSKFHDFARWNGRIHGMKMHVVYDPRVDRSASPSRRPTSMTSKSASKPPSKPARPMSSIRATAISNGGRRSTRPGLSSSRGPKATRALASSPRAPRVKRAATASPCSRTARSS